MIRTITTAMLSIELKKMLIRPAAAVTIHDAERSRKMTKAGDVTTSREGQMNGILSGVHLHRVRPRRRSISL
eukprot:4423745-Amphidinium_carterae.1